MIFTMWTKARLVVLTAVVAALYAVSLVPFKVLTIVPGITEVRPGAAIPVLCSLLFGPPAAWGAAIGNLVGDIMGGTLTPGSIFGFFANFFFGLLPWALWRVLARDEPHLRAVRQWLLLLVVCLISSAICGLLVGCGLVVLGMANWTGGLFVTYAITVNNTVMSLVLGGVLLAVLYPAVRAMGLTYSQLLPAQAAGRDLDDDQPSPTA